MSYIHVDNVVKEFKVVRREKGLKNALKSLIRREYETVTAVDHISF